MRLATKLTLWLALLYVPAFFAMGLWARQALRDSSDAVLSQAARLMASEIASAVSSDLLDDLRADNRRGRNRAENTLTELVERSDLVDGVAVIGPDAEIFASYGIDDGKLLGHELETPGQLFSRDRRPRFYADSESEIRRGRYILQVPILRGEDAAGYLRLTMTSKMLSSLYQRNERRFLILLLGALGIIVVLSFLLHVQLQRSASEVAQSIEAVLEGKEVVLPASRSEFSNALKAAGKLGKALVNERRKSALSQRQVADISRLLDVGVLLLTPGGDLEYCGLRAIEMLNLGSESEAPERWEGIRPHFEQALQQACHTPSAASFAVVELEQDGEIGRYRCELRQLTEEECTGFLVVARDMDMVKAMESDLRDAARLRGLARIYMGMAHDLRAPLNAIGLNMELLRRSNAKDPEGEPRNQRAGWIETVTRELERLGRGLGSLLDYTTLPEQRKSQFELAEVVREARDLVHPQARHQQIQLELCETDERLWVEGNRDHLKQAILSVVLNALEAMPEGGHLIVETAKEGAKAVLRIKDSGPGISVSDRDKIFNLRYTTKRDGSGVGLYVARSIAETHGGSLLLEESSAAGTAFRFDLDSAQEG